MRDDTGWFDRATEPSRAPAGRVLRLVRVPARTPDAVPMLDLRIAAGSFSESQMPNGIGFGRVEGMALRPGHFIARVVGDSMDQIAPAGAWCLWEHLNVAGVAPAAPGQNLLVRRPDDQDADLGGYTFKHLAERPEGRWLVPRSTNPTHKQIPLGADENVTAVARFVAVLEE